MSFSYSWSDSSVGSTAPTQTRQLSTSFALEILLLGAVSGLQQIEEPGLYTHSGVRTRAVGQGAVSSVHLQEFRGRLVAVKHPRDVIRSLKTPQATFDEYIRHVLAEIRVLADETLRTHPNIVRLYGYSVGSGDTPRALMIYEGSKWGSLDSFLAGVSPAPASVKANLCIDVARGLHALHASHICHGDVKAANVLVFAGDGPVKWNAKLADFGQAILGNPNNLDASVQCPLGTPLFRAPELSGSRQDFTIASAIKTDIYSFGLLAFQVLEDGQDYYQVYLASEKAGGNHTNHSNPRPFPSTTMLRVLHEYVSRQISALPNECRRVFHTIMFASLQENPGARLSMQRILDRIDREIPDEFSKHPQLLKRVEELLATYESIPLLSDDQDNESRTPEDILFDEDWWNTLENILPSLGRRAPARDVVSVLNCSLSELDDMYISRAELLDDIFPVVINEKIIEELMWVVERQRNHGGDEAEAASAAMLLAECCGVGFGLSNSTEAMISWMEQAAALGSLRAKLWLPRVQFIFRNHQNPPSPCDSFDGSFDILSLLRANGKSQREAARMQIGACHSGDTVATGKESASILLHLEVFSEGDPDMLSRLHFSSWLGDRMALDELLSNKAAINAVSPKGRTALFYACLAGHLEITNLLLAAGADPTISDLEGVTPLHLCIMFDEPNMEAACEALVSRGARLDARLKGDMFWRLYDLELVGTPVHWAISTHSTRLVEVYLDAQAPSIGLDLAIRGFFPDIIGLLLVRGAMWEGNHTPMEALAPPRHLFKHWLCHGPDRLTCITETLDVLERHGFRVQDLPIHDDYWAPSRSAYPVLLSFIASVRNEESLTLVYEYTRRVRGLRGYRRSQFDALTAAILRPTQAYGYEELLRHILAHYTPNELNSYLPDGQAYIHVAVSNGRVLATRLLLEYGADVNIRTREFHRLTPLSCALSENNPSDLIPLLIASGADIASEDTSGFFSPLGHAVKKNDLPTELYDTFLEAAGTKDIILGGLWGLIVRFRNVDRQLLVLKYLLCHELVRPHLNEPDEHGLALIYYGITSINVDILNLLLEAGVRPDTSFPATNGEYTALHVALHATRAEYESLPQLEQADREFLLQKLATYIRITRRLLESFHEVQSPWFAEITPLHLATYIGCENDVELSRHFELRMEDAHTRGRCCQPTAILSHLQSYAGSVCSTSPYYIPMSAEDGDRLFAKQTLEAQRIIKNSQDFPGPIGLSDSDLDE